MNPTAKRRRDLQQAAVLGLFLVVGAWIATIAPYPRAPLPADAPVEQFSAERAFAHIQAIARKPHPSGSASNAEVRDYISAQLRALGLSVEVQPFSFQWQNREVNAANLLARIPGARGGGESRPAPTLVCHYDSVPGGPGANDDGAGVATLLETARALKSGLPLQNDILLLFTDAEEAGLLGARAFVSSSHWLKMLGVVLNFEARGASGPVFMFESSTGNGALIQQLAKASRPVANSLMYEIYRRMPNDTDLTVFKQAQVPGLNFGFIGEPQHYHAPTDDPAHLSKRTLQHEGSYALSLARAFGSLNLSRLPGPDAVYFDLLGRVLVRYPGAWMTAFCVLASLLYLAVTFLSVRRGGASLRKILLGAVAWAGILLIITVVFGYVLNPASGLFGASHLLFKRFPGLPLWLAGVGLTATICTSLQLLLRRWLALANLEIGALCWWLVLTISTTVWMPGASYLFLWPLLFSLAGVIGSWHFHPNSWLRIAWLAGTALPALMLVSPLVYQFYVALGASALFVPMLLLTLQLGALSPQLNAIFPATTS